MPSASYGRGGGGNLKKKGAKPTNEPLSAPLLNVPDEYIDARQQSKPSIFQRISRAIPSGEPRPAKNKRGLTIDDFTSLHPPASAPSVMVTHAIERHTPSSNAHLNPSSINSKALSDTDADSFILDIRRHPSVRRMTVNGFLVPADSASTTDPRSSTDTGSFVSMNASRISLGGESTAVEGRDDIPSSPDTEHSSHPKSTLFHRRTGRARSLSVETRPKNIRFGPTRQLRPTKSILINHEKLQPHDNIVHTDPEAPSRQGEKEKLGFTRARSFTVANHTEAVPPSPTVFSSDTDTTQKGHSTPRSEPAQNVVSPEDPLRNIYLSGAVSLLFLLLVVAGREVLYLIALLPVLLAFAKHYPEIQNAISPLMK